MALQIAGTTALVTGASRGIGRALVEALLERGAARVYATARRPEALGDLVARYGERVVPLRLDVTRPSEVRAAATSSKSTCLARCRSRRASRASWPDAREPLS